MSETSPPINYSRLLSNVKAELSRRGIEPPSRKANDFLRYRSDPLGFIKTCLDVDLWTRQQEIAQALASERRVAVRSCHNSGKTFVAAALTHWWVRAFSPSLVITTAPTDRQVRKQLWGEIGSLQRKARLGGDLLSMELKVSPDQRAFGFTTNEADKFQGWHDPNILFIVDEASGVEPAIYEAIEGCLTSHNARLLLIGNPNSPDGTFYEAFRSPLYTTFHISADDVPAHLLPPDWKEERLNEWGADNPAYQVRVLGNFPDQGEDSLIRLSWVENAQNRDVDDEDEGAGRDVVVGVDIARYGGDESVAYVRRGSVVVDASYWRGNDTMASAGRIASLARQWGAGVINVDEIGVGAGVVDRLHEEGLPVIGVNVGESARDSEHYANLRSEIFQGLADRFKEGDISLPGEDPILLSQLTALKFSYTPRGQMKLESKEDMRKRRGTTLGWASPDRADALALCFAVAGNRWVPMVEAGDERPFWS